MENLKIGRKNSKIQFRVYLPRKCGIFHFHFQANNDDIEAVKEK